MELIKKHLKEKYQLSNYQIAQIGFLFKTLFSELSKMVIMGIIFHNQLALYLFALFVMLFLRCSTGGLHFYTYLGCLGSSIAYVGLALLVLPLIKLSTHMQLLLLLICILVCNVVGPVVSKYRPTPSKELYSRGKKTTCMFIFIYSLALYIIPENAFLTVGFWIIILHSLQLIVAKIRKKGDCIKCFPTFLILLHHILW